MKNLLQSFGFRDMRADTRTNIQTYCCREQINKFTKKTNSKMEQIQWDSNTKHTNILHMYTIKQFTSVTPELKLGLHVNM